MLTSLTALLAPTIAFAQTSALPEAPTLSPAPSHAYEAASAVPAAASTAALNVCSFEWEVRARGIALGITQDTVRWDSNSSGVVSKFTPNAMASILGAPTVERTWSSSKSQGIVREENKYTSEEAPYNVRWAVKGTKMWKTVNKQPRDEFPTPAGIPGQRYIDSSVFPYLDLVGQPINAAPTQAWVLNQRDPYQATMQRTAESAEYSAGNKRGTVWLTEGKPTKLSFSEGTEKFESTVVSSKCN